MSSADALKKPQTAYFLWNNANREKIQNMCGAKDFKTVAAKASELWKAATAAEKKPFEAEAKRQKEAYDAFIATEDGQRALQEKKQSKKEEKQAKEEKETEKAKKKEEKETRKEMRECKAAVKAVDKDEKLKKPLSAYFAWLNDNRDRIVAQLGGKGGPQVTKKGAEMWKTLPEREKKPYEDRARKAKEEYDAYIATEEGAAALKAYKEAAAAVAYKPKVADEDDDGDAQDGSPKKAATKRKVSSPEKTSAEKSPKGQKRKAGGSPTAPSAKRGRGKGKATEPEGLPLDEGALTQARKAGYEDALRNLAGRKDVAASGKSPKELLSALQASGGLVNKAKFALLGA